MFVKYVIGSIYAILDVRGVYIDIQRDVRVNSYVNKSTHWVVFNTPGSYLEVPCLVTSQLIVIGASAALYLKELRCSGGKKRRRAQGNDGTFLHKKKMMLALGYRRES